MKNSLIYAIVGFVTAMCLPFSPASADDQLITVPDAGFDDHVLNNVGGWIYIGDGSYTGAWKSLFAENGAWIDYGYYADDPAGPDLPALSGNNKAYGTYTADDYIYQILDETFIEGGTYTLSVWVGIAWSGYDDYWSLYFTGEDHNNNLIEASGNAPVGSWQQVSLVYTATAADAGRKVGIKMKGVEYVTFEDVTLYGPPKTRDPLPADGALVMDTWVNLYWTPANFAVTNDVYMGDNFDDVNNGAESTFQGNQTDTFIVAGFPGFPFPDGLVNGVTYYWRIDGINDTNPNSPLKGDVWSFTVVPKIAYNPDPADGAESVGVDDSLSWTAGFGAKLHHVYFGDNFDEVDNAAGALPQGNATYSPGPLKMAKTYYWRVDEFDAVETHKGHVWSFTTQGAVGNPDPANGAVDVKQTQIITWSPSVFAASHQVYFGADKDAVKNADTSSPEYKGTRDLGAETYDPGMLEWDTTYYWRIDEVNNTNPDSPWPGILWSFTTANFLVVDDFEDYDAYENQIWWSWKDGLGYAAHGNEPAYPGNGTGSAVGDESTASYTEETIVHGGNQSIPLFYNNSVLLYSEVEKTLTYPRDWTENGVTNLSIWFRGDLDNAAEMLYVALNGGAVVSHDNPDAAQINKWSQWNIDLQAFADQGVNLVNVNTIGLGLGNKKNPVAGGSGTMYFDDIRLYPLELETP